MPKATLGRLDPLHGQPGRHCDFLTCHRSAEYRAIYKDHSWTYVCPDHATQLARAAGWADAS